MSQLYMYKYYGYINYSYSIELPTSEPLSHVIECFC